MTLRRQASADQLTPATCNKRLRAGRWTREQVDNSQRSATLDLYRPKFGDFFSFFILLVLVFGTVPVCAVD